MSDSKIVPISPIMPIGKPIDPPPMARRCASNTPVTWGELYALFDAAGQAKLAEATLDKIFELDARGAA